MPAPSNTEQRREEIAQALARVMAKEGYDGATVGAIAREAGVAAGGVHYHFASKLEILTYLIERLVAAAQRRIDDRVARAADDRERFTATLDGLLALGADAEPGAVAVWALIGAEAIRNEEVGRLYAEWLATARERLRAGFASACRAEGRSGAGATRTAATLVALVEGYYAVAAGAPGVIPAGSAAPSTRFIAGALLDAQLRRAA
jgi:TetR/AcrR family transcriptional repressor of bet genes